MMGVVHHANYVLYFEDARTRLLEELGYPYEQLEREGFMSPVVSVELHYGKPLRYGDKPVVRTRVAALTQMKVTFAYEIFESAEAMESGGEAELQRTERPLHSGGRLLQAGQHEEGGPETVRALPGGSGSLAVHQGVVELRLGVGCGRPFVVDELVGDRQRLDLLRLEGVDGIHDGLADARVEILLAQADEGIVCKQAVHGGGEGFVEFIEALERERHGRRGGLPIDGHVTDGVVEAGQVGFEELVGIDAELLESRDLVLACDLVDEALIEVLDGVELLSQRIADGLLVIGTACGERRACENERTAERSKCDNAGE